MKPREIIEKEKLGYTELTEEQIEKYVNCDVESGSIFITYDYEVNKYQKGSINFGLKVACDYYYEVEKRCFGLFHSNKDAVYYYNDDLKIFFIWGGTFEDRIPTDEKLIAEFSDILRKKENK